MTDRDLLELAAKAAGYKINKATQNRRDELLGREDASLWLEDGTTVWNPLRDGAHALRLASRLRLIIKPGKYHGEGCTVESQAPGGASYTAFDDDKDRQMRRAIVVVAANTGKAMA